jgi:hypothetical protein
MIHYHGMSGGGKTEDHVALASGRHVFVSFAKPQVLPLVASVCASFALDNGAFTAWKSKKAYDWEGFEVFVKDWHRHPAFDFIVIPDVIDGSEDENDALLEKWGKSFRTIGSMVDAAPVWHLHESLDRLDRLTHYGRVCLGSSGIYGTPGTETWWTRIEEAMEVLCDSYGKPKVKLHGLRMLNPEVFTRLPLHSADSTNAERNGLFTQRFGMYPAPTRGQRAAVIADRVESQQSASSWTPSRQIELNL